MSAVWPREKGEAGSAEEKNASSFGRRTLETVIGMSSSIQTSFGTVATPMQSDALSAFIVASCLDRMNLGLVKHQA